MNKNGTSRTYDYSYLIAAGGIGVLFSCAAFMIGVAFRAPVYGYFSAGVILTLTAVYLMGAIKKVKPISNKRTEAPHASKVDHIGVAMLMTSPAGDVVFSNKSAKTLFERYDFGEPKSPLLMDISNKISLENALNELGVGKMKFVICEVRDSGKYLKFEVEKIHKNGDFFSWRIFEDARAGLPVDVDGMGAVNVNNLGRFFESSDIGFLSLNQTSKVTSMNGVLESDLFEGGTVPEYPFSLSVISQHSANNFTGDVDFYSNNGEIKPYRVEPWNAGEGAQKCFIVVPNGKNQSQKKATDGSALSENSFFGSSPIGIAVIGADGDILNKNIVFGNFIAGLGLDETNKLSDILTDDNAQEVIKIINQTIESGKPGNMVDLSFKGLSDKQGQFYITRANDAGRQQVIAYLIDTTEQKSLELQFSQSQKMQAVGQLAGGVAHDFNNLLTAITGFCDLLLVKHGPGDQSFSDIIQIKQNANRAANLVRQLLAFSRQQTLRPKVLNMTDVVAELSNLLRRLIGSNIHLKINHGRTIAPVRVDQGQLEQVIINLCVNARDAMPDGGELEIKTRNISEEEAVKIAERYQIFPKGEYVLLEVNDNGTGIAKEHLGKVFEPFFSTKDVGKGTGLGLSTVYGIIKQTDGFVFPESELGVGTSFKIYLPQYIEQEDEGADAEEQVTAPEERAQDLTGSSTILLVEDEDAVRMFASRALKNKGYTVYEADSGVSALALLEDTDINIDLLISDVMMPQMDGPSLVKKIKETDKNLKVIFISGYAEDALDDNIMEKDFNFLSKPFSLKQLAAQVKEVLEK